MEDEAVIHRVLKESKSSVKLMDINLPNLKCSKGLNHWTPCSRDMVSYSKPSEILPKWVTTLHHSMFPPSPEEAKDYNLEKCIRVLPHQQDTGGFFIALLTKTSELPWEPNPFPTTTANDGTDFVNNANANRPPPKKMRRSYGGYKEDPFIFMKDDESIWPALREFYNLDPSLESSNFLRRCTSGRIKNMYLTTKIVRDFVMTNENAVKIINVGVKALARVDKKWGPCDFRISQEGLPALLPYIKGRIVNITKEDLHLLLLFDDTNVQPPLNNLSESTRKQIEHLERGSVVLQVDTEMEDNGPKFRMVLVGWRGTASLRAYVQKAERIHHLRLCGGDVSKFEKNKFKDREASSQGADEEDSSEIPPPDSSAVNDPNADEEELNGNDNVNSTELCV